MNQKCFKPYTSCSQLLGLVPCQLLLLVFCFYTITNCLLRLRFVINDDVQLLDRTWTKSRNMTARRSGKTEERVHGEEKRSCICFWLVHTTIYRLYTGIHSLNDAHFIFHDMHGAHLYLLYIIMSRCEHNVMC